MKALLKGKGKTLKADFDVTIHTLAPWTPAAGPLSIRWARGAAKRGLAGPPVQACAPHTNGYAAYEFGQAFSVPATLTKVSREKGERSPDRTPARAPPILHLLSLHPPSPPSP